MTFVERDRICEARHAHGRLVRRGEVLGGACQLVLCVFVIDHATRPMMAVATLSSCLVLGCAAAPSLPRQTLAAPVAAETPEPPRLRWRSVQAGARVCGTDERFIDWCWAAYALDAEPVAVEFRWISMCALGARPSPRSTCRVTDSGEVGCHWGVFARWIEPQIELVVIAELGRPTRVVTRWPDQGAEVCGIYEDGSVRCAGPLDAVVGPPPSGALRPVSVRELALAEPALELVVADDQVCARHESGRVSCWAEEQPTLIAGLDDAHRLVMDEGSACAYRAEGRVSCWPAGASEAIELQVPADRPTTVEKLTLFRSTLGIESFHSEHWSGMRLDDLLHPPFIPNFDYRSSGPAFVAWPRYSGWDRWRLDWRTQLEARTPVRHQSIRLRLL